MILGPLGGAVAMVCEAAMIAEFSGTQSEVDDCLEFSFYFFSWHYIEDVEMRQATSIVWKYFLIIHMAWTLESRSLRNFAPHWYISRLLPLP